MNRISRFPLVLLGMPALLGAWVGEAHGHGKACVSSEKDNALTVIDLKSQAVVGKRAADRA